MKDDRADPLAAYAEELDQAEEAVDHSVSRMVEKLTPSELATLNRQLAALDAEPCRELESGSPEPSEAMGWGPDDGSAEEMMERAELEAELEAALARDESSDGARSCRWCQELIEEAGDEAHEFCEPDETTERLVAADLDAVSLRWSDQVLCANCKRWHFVELVAPPLAIDHNMLTSTTIACPCSARVTLAYSWRRRAVVGLRYEKPDTRLLN